MRIRCPKCSAEWEGKDRIGVRDECPECAAYLHTCTNCVNYDAALSDCRIPTTDAVHDRQGQNFCDEFTFGPPSAEKPSGKPAEKPAEKRLSPEEARKRFDELFGDGGT